MDPATVLIELGLLVWVGGVLIKEGWKVDQPGVLWAMTSGALVTNALLMLVILPMIRAEAGKQGLSAATVNGFLVFRVVEWTVIVHLVTRMALSLRKHSLPGGIALTTPGRFSRRIVVIAVGTGIVASLIGIVLVELWVRIGILEKPIWVMIHEAGGTWQAAIVGGIRNLFSEEVVTRLGVQTLCLYHLRRIRGSSWLAAVLSCLFFEVWHSGLEDLYFLNFAISLPFAWSFHRYGYEAAAIAHCVADWLALGLPLFLLVG